MLCALLRLVFSGVGVVPRDITQVYGPRKVVGRLDLRTSGIVKFCRLHLLKSQKSYISIL